MCAHWPLNNLSCESFSSLEIWSILFLWLLPSSVPIHPYCCCVSVITADPELAASLIRHGGFCLLATHGCLTTLHQKSTPHVWCLGQCLLPLTADLVKAGEKTELLWQPPFSVPLTPWGPRPGVSTLPISLPLSPRGPRRLPFPFGNTIPVHLAQWHFLPHFFYCSSSKAAFCFLTILHRP